MTTANQVIIKVRSDAHQLSADKFWLGFIIWHRENETNQPCVSAIEIAGLGLSINNRQKGGFSYPVDIRNKYRMTLEVMFQYLLEIENIDQAFEFFKPVDQIKFIFASKNTLSIAEQNGFSSIDFISNESEKTLCVDNILAQYSAIAWPFAAGSGQKISLDIKTKGEPIIEWLGDIGSYLKLLQEKLNPIISDIPSSTIDSTSVSNNVNKVLILNKGDRRLLFALEKRITKIKVGLGWDLESNEEQIELDASLFLLNEHGVVSGDQDFIYYHQLVSSCASVCLELYPDSQVGQDKAKIVIDLNGLASSIHRIAICVSIYDADIRRQSFNQVLKPYLRICDLGHDQEFIRFNLLESYETETAMIFGEIYLHKKEWKVNAVGQGFLGGLPAMCQKFGVEIK